MPEGKQVEMHNEVENWGLKVAIREIVRCTGTFTRWRMDCI